MAAALGQAIASGILLKLAADSAKANASQSQAQPEPQSSGVSSKMTKDTSNRDYRGESAAWKNPDLLPGAIGTHIVTRETSNGWDPVSDVSNSINKGLSDVANGANRELSNAGNGVNRGLSDIGNGVNREQSNFIADETEQLQLGDKALSNKFNETFGSNGLLSMHSNDIVGDFLRFYYGGPAVLADRFLVKEPKDRAAKEAADTQAAAQTASDTAAAAKSADDTIKANLARQGGLRPQASSGARRYRGGGVSQTTTSPLGQPGNGSIRSQPKTLLGS